MQIQNDFVVDAPLERVWAYVLDIEKVAPCMPGAELTDTVDDSTWKGKVAVKLGPVSMSFAGTVKLQERDDAAHRVVLKADGREQKGRGAASANVTADMEPADGGGTKVAFVSDITITGAAAQYGRGMIQDISAKLTGEFANCLQSNIRAEEVAAEAAAATHADAVAAPGGATPATQVRYVTAKPVKGIRLGVWAMWQAVVRFFRRLFGGGRSA